MKKAIRHLLVIAHYVFGITLVLSPFIVIAGFSAANVLSGSQPTSSGAVSSPTTVFEPASVYKPWKFGRRVYSPQYAEQMQKAQADLLTRLERNCKQVDK